MNLRAMARSTVTPDAHRVRELNAQMRARFARYTTAALVGIEATPFRERIEAAIGREDAGIEGYADEEIDRQRDLSVKFHWGHDHDFGTFAVPGRMGARHLEVMAHFLTVFALTPDVFRGAAVLDVGCWTGGTTLLLAALGAQVHALEEVRKYADMTHFLVDAFGLRERVSVTAQSIYECSDGRFHDRFDIVYVPGVVYHLSDPVLALRILFNTLKPGGIVLVESDGIESDEPLCRFDGSFLYHSGTAAERSRGGWNWFVPSPVALARMLREAGFEEERSCYVKGFARVFAIARKIRQNPMCRAGLSLRTIR